MILRQRKPFILHSVNFPVNLVLDLFWSRVSQEKVDKMPYNYGQMAGLPAGKGITKLSDIDQFLNLSVGEYITLKTDSIIPMQAYRLKSSTDAGNISYRRGTYRHYDSSWQWPDFHTNKLMGKYFYIMDITW